MRSRTQWNVASARQRQINCSLRQGHVTLFKCWTSPISATAEDNTFQSWYIGGSTSAMFYIFRLLASRRRSAIPQKICINIPPRFVTY